ncbi:hypothetical protein [Micromonospora sp. WMMD998]|uniref:allene oxide cyclase barrel-like domain-containing protein n=1 Tax=Micromonospora sp. WMMD998 TaxID=3016092 RepID=UPI002499E8F6|nr:hypothetical protein [Micromonospora sp. WMMD998]WFE39903.1 hypothetical protein O7619_16280 [Micromonospora sp. WMMD998]
MRKPRPKRLTALLSTIVLGGAATAVLGGSAASAVPAAHPRPCVVTADLTDQSHLTKHDGRAPGTTDGDTVVYHDDVYNAAGELVVTGEGTALVYTNPVDGTLWEWLAVTVQMPSGGTLFGTVPISIADAVAGKPQTIPLIGTAGDTLGKTGSWKFSLRGYTNVNLSIFDVTLTICG